MRTRLLKLSARCLALALMLHAGPSLAAAQWCSGTINALWVDSAGNVYIYPSWRADHLRVCNVNEAVASAGGPSVSITTCLSWLSLLKAGNVAAKSMITHYVEAPACSAIPTYVSAPTPSYIMLQ